MIRLSKSSISNLEIDNVTRVLKDEYLGMGAETRKFEEELSQRFSSGVVCVNSGTAALHLAFQSLGLKHGDEVLCPSITFLGTYQAVSATGAAPIACDIDSATILLDLKDAQKKITSKTKAICLVHYCGNTGDLEEYYDFAQKNGLRVVEDAAHAFGGKYKGKEIGSFGDVVCFSFDGIKNITCGEGGAIISKDNEVISRARDLRLLGVVGDSEKRYIRERSWTFDVLEQGWRYHMSDVMAAIGRMQLQREHDFAYKRKILAESYVQKIVSSKLSVEVIDIDYNEVVPHIFVIKVPKGTRDDLKDYLLECEIQTGIHYLPNHRLNYVRKISGEQSCPIADEVYSRLLTLPLHVDLTEEDIVFVIEKLKVFYSLR